MAIIISDTEPRVQYTATAGQTSFTVGFEFFDNADLKVFNGTTQLTYSASPANATQYSVSGAGQTGGGSITLGAPGATLNDTITIYRDLAIERTTDFPTSGAFQIGSLNTELDKIIAMCQQLERDLKFSPKAAATTANTYNITFPNLAANKVLSVNSAGNGLEFSQDITDITTIAGIASDITTVSGIASNVTTVAGAVSNVNTVATNITNINTVATNIADIITVANDLNEAVSEIETVASDLQEVQPEIDTVAGSITNVNTVGTNIANVNTVAGISSNVTTVAGAVTNINTVATNIANVNIVGGISANVTTVAGISADVTAVAGDATDIGTVATDLAGSNNIGTVAGSIANVNTVAGISGNVTTVAGISANVNTVAGISSNVSTVAGISSDVTSVAGISANVTTVANNISDVNNFAAVYRIGSSNPAVSLDEGDLFYNSTDNKLKYYNGSAWTNVESTDTSNLATNGFAIAMAIAL